MSIHGENCVTRVSCKMKRIPSGSGNAKANPENMSNGAKYKVHFILDRGERARWLEEVLDFRLLLKLDWII